MPHRPAKTHCDHCGYLSGSALHQAACGPGARHGRAWAKGSGGSGQRIALSLFMWPGITKQLDGWCSCTLAMYRGVYQVKVRDTSCRNHGGDLAAALARMERLP